MAQRLVLRVFWLLFAFGIPLQLGTVLWRSAGPVLGLLYTSRDVDCGVSFSRSSISASLFLAEFSVRGVACLGDTALVLFSAKPRLLGVD